MLGDIDGQEKGQRMGACSLREYMTETKAEPQGKRRALRSRALARTIASRKHLHKRPQISHQISFQSIQNGGERSPTTDTAVMALQDVERLRRVMEESEEERRIRAVLGRTMA